MKMKIKPSRPSPTPTSRLPSRQAPTLKHNFNTKPPHNQFRQPLPPQLMINMESQELSEFKNMHKLPNSPYPLHNKNHLLNKKPPSQLNPLKLPQLLLNPQSLLKNLQPLQKGDQHLLALEFPTPLLHTLYFLQLSKLHLLHHKIILNKLKNSLMDQQQLQFKIIS